MMFTEQQLATIDLMITELKAERKFEEQRLNYVRVGAIDAEIKQLMQQVQDDRKERLQAAFGART